jgi:hypothetical protein
VMVRRARSQAKPGSGSPEGLRLKRSSSIPGSKKEKRVEFGHRT